MFDWLFGKTKKSEYPKLIKISMPKNVQKGTMEITMIDGTKIMGFEVKGTYRMDLNDGPMRQYFIVPIEKVLEEVIDKNTFGDVLVLSRTQRIPLIDIESIDLINIREHVVDLPRRIWLENKEHELRFIEDDEKDKPK